MKKIIYIALLAMTSSWAYAGLADIVSATKAVADKTESVVDAVEGKKEAVVADVKEDVVADVKEDVVADVKEAVVADVKEAVVTNIKEAIPSAVKAAK